MSTYLGINIVLATPDDYRFALLLHDRHSYAVKLANHDLSGRM